MKLFFATGQSNYGEVCTIVRAESEGAAESIIKEDRSWYDGFIVEIKSEGSSGILIQGGMDGMDWSEINNERGN